MSPFWVRVEGVGGERVCGFSDWVEGSGRVAVEWVWEEEGDVVVVVVVVVESIVFIRVDTSCGCPCISQSSNPLKPTQIYDIQITNTFSPKRTKDVRCQTRSRSSSLESLNPRGNWN
jgi:hypothetical protein